MIARFLLPFESPSSDPSHPPPPPSSPPDPCFSDSEPLEHIMTSGVFFLFLCFAEVFFWVFFFFFFVCFF